MPLAAEGLAFTMASITVFRLSFSFSTPRGNVRSDYAAQGNGLTIFFPGGSDTGTWRTEDGRVCMDLRKQGAVCNDIRLVGSELYQKRSTGDVVKSTPVK